MSKLSAKLFEAALKYLEIGTTKNEFATAYANASNSKKGSSIWQQYYEQGEKEFSTIDIHNGSEGVIDEEEFNLLNMNIERLNGKDPYSITTIEKFSGNDHLESYRAAEGTEQPAANPQLPEQYHLKPFETMTRDEIKTELAKYKELGISDIKSPEQGGKSEEKGMKLSIDEKSNIMEEGKKELLNWASELKQKKKKNNVSAEDAELNNLKKELEIARAKYNQIDAKSDVVDFHIGTFNQGSLGDCTFLSQLNGLSDDVIKRMVKPKTDESGKIYYEVTFPMDEGTNNTVTVTKEELDSRQLSVSDGVNTKIVSRFATGDADVTLMEMAYIKRFGINPIVDGADIKLVHDIFTFPEENKKHVGTSYEVTEDKIQKAIQGGDHASLTIIPASRLSEGYSYAEPVVGSDGTTAKWAFGEERTAVLERLAALYAKLGNTDFDISKYENMSDGELMDAISRYVSPDFYFIGKLELSNGMSMIEVHSYTLKDYNPETKQVTLANPQKSNEDIVLPLEIAQRFLEISV